MPVKKGIVQQVAPSPDPSEGECICSVRFCAFAQCVFVHLFGAFSCICSVRFCAFARCVFILRERDRERDRETDREREREIDR